MTTKKEAIPFITITEGDKGQVSFNISKEAVEVLSQPFLKGKKLAIVAIAGPQRTGKSFLANRLLKRMDGFAIGPSTIPCTKGIWIWSEPVKVNEDTYMIIIDTEGLNSVQRDINVDIKIFALSILLSSVFIYNSIGHIDEKALENMSLVLSLSNSICTKKGQEDDSDMGKYFPYFYWVLRDFSLDLKGKSEKEYLDECLKPISTNDKDPKNQIRAKLNKFFPYRTCECFPRPLTDEKRLAHIEQEKFQNLRPAFVDKMKSFEKSFFSSMPVKLINGKPINSDMFIALTYEYLSAINGGGVPQILTSLQRVIMAEARKVIENLQGKSHHNEASYVQAMNECVKEDKLPLDQSIIEESHNHYSTVVMQRFDEKLKSILQPAKAKELKADLMQFMKKQYETRMKYNSDKSEIKCKELLNKFESGYKFPQIDNVDAITASLVQEKYQQYRKGIKEYLDKTKAPKKYIYFIEKVPKFLFDFFDKLVEKVKKVLMEECTKYKVIAKQSQQMIDRIRTTMKHQEQMLNDRTKELQDVTHNRDMLRYELNNMSSAGDTSGLMKDDLENSLESRKKKITTLKNQKLELEDMCAKLRAELVAKKTEIITLQRKLKEQERQTGRQDEELASEIFGYMNELKDRLVEMDQYYKNKLQEANPQIRKCREIQEIRQQKLLAIERCREELRQKKQENRQRMEKMKESHDKDIEILNKHLKNVMAQNTQLKEKFVSTPGNEQKLKALMLQRKKFEDALKLKQNNINNQNSLIGEKDIEINKLTTIITDLNDKLAILNAEKASMTSFKETFGFVLRESLNWALNRPNKLKHSVKTLSQDDFEIIKQSFSELKLNPF